MILIATGTIPGGNFILLPKFNAQSFNNLLLPWQIILSIRTNA